MSGTEQEQRPLPCWPPAEHWWEDDGGQRLALLSAASGSAALV